MSGYKTGGLEERFIIERADGAPIEPDRRYCMVLDFSGRDPHAIKAAESYAVSVAEENPSLAQHIRAAIADPARRTKQHRY